MKKLTIGIIAIIFFLTGCLPNSQDKKEIKDSNIKKQNANITEVKKTASKFKITNESMVGNWYVVASNPNPEYFNKILVGADYITFYPDGVTKHKVFLPDRVDEKVGKYIIDTSTNEVTIKYNELHHKWRQISSGKALEFYWVNTELDFEKSLNNVYIKKGSKEWNN